MDRVLVNIEPQDVFNFFEDICNIPHVSYHTDLISDYCEKFAKTRELRYVRDNTGNVIIYKDATEGYEGAPTVIIQGHLDMVGAKAENSTHDFLNDPLKIYIDNGYITADGTTLGADNGIAIAMALAILDNNNLKHPALEMVFTVNEETGLEGAKALDGSLLKGKYLLNLDSDGEDIFLTGSAGGLTSELLLVVNRTEYEGTKILISIGNLTGGHSGAEIGTGRPSANVLMGRLLKELNKTVDFGLESLNGGEVENAICQKCNAVIIIDYVEIESVKAICNGVMSEFRKEYAGIDDNITITCEENGSGKYSVCDDLGLKKIICMLYNLPYGVIARNAQDVNLVETSLNPGVVSFDDRIFSMLYSVRSSIESAKRDIADRLKYMSEMLGGNYEESGDYPAWTHRQKSVLRDIISDTYEEMYNIRPKYTTIHAGLECGILSEKLPDVDIVSYGPHMQDIHTYDERLSIESVEKIYKFTLKLLEKITTNN